MFDIQNKAINRVNQFYLKGIEEQTLHEEPRPFSILKKNIKKIDLKRFLIIMTYLKISFKLNKIYT